MIVAFFVVLGVYSYYRIGVELLPALNTPYVTVTVKYPGASAESVEQEIIKPVENAVSSVSASLESSESSASASSLPPCLSSSSSRESLSSSWRELLSSAVSTVLPADTRSSSVPLGDAAGQRPRL